MKLQVQKLHPDATMPSFAYDADAGMDLYASVGITIEPGERAQVSTGVAMRIPSGYVGLIWDKSGISHKVGLKTLGGVVDSGYRGELLIGLLNTANESHVFAVGDKIAQILIQKVEHFEVEEVDELEESDRGTKGFGSTGV